MTNRSVRTLVIAGLVAALCYVLPVAACAQEVVVANPTVPNRALPRNVVRAIFGMRLRIWPDGTPVRVFVLHDESPIHRRFLKETLHVYPHQLRRAWDRLVYSGMGQAPVRLRSEDEMRLRVSSTPGAIGYLSEQMVSEDMHTVEVVQ